MADWRNEAACRDYDFDGWYDPWFPPGSEKGTGGDYTTALLYCSSCPVRVPCGEAAIREETVSRAIPDGMRGGLTPKQRVMLRRRPA